MIESTTEQSIVSDPAKITLEQALAKRVGDALNRWYPGYLWGVNVEQGLVLVHNLTLSGNWGFVLKEENISASLQEVMRAGGEILERYFLPRREIDEATLVNLPTDFAGRLAFSQ